MTEDLTEIHNAISNNDPDLARQLLREALQNPTADVYYLASQVALSDAQQLDFLQKALELDPFHQQAADELSQLHRGQAQGQAIVPESGTDSARVTAAVSAKTAPSKAQLPDYLPAPKLKYDRRRLVPLASVGIPCGCLIGYAVVDGGVPLEIATPISWVLGAIGLVCAIGLVVQHRRSPLRQRLWHFQIELLVLLLPSAVGTIAADFQTSLPLMPAPWIVLVAGAIIGGNVLLFSETPESETPIPSD